MNTKEIKKELEEKVNELESYVTSEVFENASEEERKKYIELITDIKVKLEILNNL